MGRHSTPDDPEDSANETPNAGDGYQGRGYRDDPRDGYRDDPGRRYSGPPQYSAPPPNPGSPQNPGGDRYYDGPGDGYDEYADDDYADDATDDTGHGGADYWQPDAGVEHAGRVYEGADYESAHYEGADYEGNDFAGEYEDEYAEDDFARPGLVEAEPETYAFASSAPPPNRPPTSGPQHGGDWDGGDWTGSHRAIQPGRRGVSVGVIVALVTVVVVVGAVILWRFFGDALHSRSQAAAARCVAGEVAVAVVADPSIADQLTPLAEKYNQTADPIGDRCVKVGVTAANSDQVLNGIVGTWPGDLGERPALWIPGSSISTARLEAAKGTEAVSNSRSLVTSPVMLAMRPEMKSAMALQNWSTLPALQGNPKALDALNLPGWGSLRLALPLTDDGDATFLAAEAVAAASIPAGAPATSGANAVSALLAGQPKLADTKGSTAMDALVQDGSPATAQVHAVVATEQQIYQRGTSLSDAKNTLASWLPPGPTATADYPAVLLAGNGLSPEQVSAASEFERFLRKPDALAEFAKAGFRTDGGSKPDSDVTDFGTLKDALDVGDNTVRATLANLVSAPAQNSAVTIMLDQSMSGDDGGKPRIANVTSALNARLNALAPSSTVGLWTFDGVEGRTEVATGPLDEPIGGQPRSEVLTTNLAGQTASGGGAVSFTTLRELYNAAVANYREGQSNSVLVITQGPHTDRSLDGAGLQDVIRQGFNQAKPVTVNIIDFGSDADRSTWEAVAQTTGGQYQNLNSSAGPDLTTALATLLG
jgi:Bacterial extracellular solute-binding protein